MTIGDVVQRGEAALQVEDVEALRAALAQALRLLRPRQRRGREVATGQQAFIWKRPGDTYRPSYDRPDTLDLTRRYHDVELLTRARPEFRACLLAGWAEEDVIQEVYVRCLARQSMKSRYDPKRGSVSKYLTVFAKGVLLNLLQISRRRGAHEALGESEDASVMVSAVWEAA